VFGFSQTLQTSMTDNRHRIHQDICKPFHNEPMGRNNSMTFLFLWNYSNKEAAIIAERLENTGQHKEHNLVAS